MTLNSRPVLASAARVRPSLSFDGASRRNALRPQFRRLNSAVHRCIRSQSTGAAINPPSLQSNAAQPSYDLPIATGNSTAALDTGSKNIRAQWLPASCPGCGALSQSINDTEAGFYSKSRRAVKSYLQATSALVSQTLKNSGSLSSPEEAHKHRQDESTVSVSQDDGKSVVADLNHLEAPICDRCHDLVYNNKGQSIAHPTIEALTDSIAESPFKRNHVYHVLDAVDFPMSLIPRIFQTLELAKPRSQNRRSRTRFTTKPTISFIITRSDLLGPTKEMVDKLMPYYQNVLRSALGRYGRDIRLGNVHLVSAKRGWWTKEIKDSIWNRGGGSWMVGKANVGKSNLFPVLFPKGSGERAPIYAELQEQSQKDEGQAQSVTCDQILAEDSLLPPAQPETAFPAMPIVSHLPGTTASPIRLPFGNHKGELIDLPGLDRGNLEEHVRPENKLDLVMQYRPNVKQYIVKPGQSLILGGGLIRITPELDGSDRSTTLLAYPFVPIDAHVTATDKAIAIESQDRESGIKSILAEGASATLRSSGVYDLYTDVTKTRAGALLRAGVPISKLPFRVYASDLLIEGVGWVELVCQTRRQRTSLNSALHPPSTNVQPEEHGEQPDTSDKLQDPDNTISDFKPFFEQTPAAETQARSTNDFSYPKVEVFSPHGKHIGQRQSLGAWTLWESYKEQRRGTAPNVRPRKSMKGVKKREKMERRASPAIEVC